MPRNTSSAHTSDVFSQSGPTAQVPKDPQPSVDRIEELAKRVLLGDIVLPRFQRDFVWDGEQIIQLLDSIAKGFPIGSILLWQSRQELRSERRIADLDVELPRPDYPVNYLLDGQQRLSTVCGALYWKRTRPSDRWNLCYDLADKTFKRLETLDEPPIHQICVNKIADGAAFYQHVAQINLSNRPDVDELRQNADLLFTRFKDYRIAVVTLGDMRLQDVAPIFERINSEGTRLTIVDLMRAATWSPTFDLVDEIQKILDELAARGFSSIERKVVLRNVSAAVTGSFTTSGIDALRDQEESALANAIEASGDAYKLAVDFFATDMKIPNADVLPYANQMTVAAEVFRRLPVPSSAQSASLRRWFWRTTAAEYFGGWSSTNMAADMEAIKRFTDGAAAELAGELRAPPLSLWGSRSFRSNTAASKLLALMLAGLGPIDLLTGRLIDVNMSLAWQNAKEFHHFFPKDYITNSLSQYKSQVNCLANIIFLTSASNKTILNRAPSDYLKQVEDAAGSQLQTWLDANCISDAAYAAAKQNDFPMFIAERSKSLSRLVNRLGGWQAMSD